MKSTHVDVFVYVTSHGGSFHHHGHFLRGKMRVNLNDALEEGYTPCTSCWWPDRGTPQVQPGRAPSSAFARLARKQRMRR